MEPNLDTTRVFPLFAHAWRQRSKIVGIFLVLWIVTAMVTAMTEREYESEAKLQIQVGRESVALEPTATLGPYVGVADTRETEIQAIEELLYSKSVLGKVVDELGVDEVLGVPKWYASGGLSWLDAANLNPLRVYDRKAKAVKILQRFLKVEIPRNSKIVTLRFAAEDPRVAQEVLETLIKVAIDEHLQVNRNEESLKFFKVEADRLHERVMSLENDLAANKKATGISSVEHQRRLYIEQIAKYKDEISHLNASSMALTKELEVRRQQLEKIPKMLARAEVSGTANNPEFEMRVELFRLEIKEKELASKFDDTNDQLIQVRRQIKLARETLQQQDPTRQLTQGNNDERDRYELAMFEREAELVEGQARQTELKTDLVALQSSLTDLDNKAKLISDLERELALADSAYRKYNEGLEIARIEQQRVHGRLSNIHSLQTPSFSAQPTGPKALVNFIAGTFLAGALSLGVVALSARGRSPNREVALREVSHSPLDSVRHGRREAKGIPTA